MNKEFRLLFSVPLEIGGYVGGVLSYFFLVYLIFCMTGLILLRSSDPKNTDVQPMWSLL